MVTREEWAVEVTGAALERVERRLSDDIGVLRTEARAVEATLSLRMLDLHHALEQAIAAQRDDFLKRSLLHAVVQAAITATMLSGALLFMNP